MVSAIPNKADAIYARYSSHAQDDGTSIEVQIEQCERSAGRKCLHYIDRAKTGRAMGGRTQLLSLLADAEAGKIGRVFVYKFDRLGRAAETHVIAQQLEDTGAQLVSATEGTNQLARGIQLVVAEDYSRQLAARTRDGLLKRFEQGAFTGGIAPYGYRVAERNGRRVLEVEPAEAAIVREIASMYISQSLGFKSIAKRLRERSVSSRRGKGWSFTSVRSLLMNPLLTGLIRYNVRSMHLDRRTGRRLPRQKDASQHLERQDESLRILDDATFAKVQQQIGKSARGLSTRGGGRTVAPFTGLVYCACGSKCYRVHSKNAKGEYYYYVCGRHLRYADCPHSARIREDELIDFVKGGFQHVLSRADEIIARATELAREAVKSNRGEADRLKADLAAVESDQERLIELMMDRSIGEAAKQSINRKLADAEARRAKLHEALDGLRETANENTDQLAETIRELFDAAQENLAAVATPEQYNRFIDQIIGPMEVAPGKRPVQKKMPAAEATGDNLVNGKRHLPRLIAGGGFEPPTSGL